ncbi:DUF2779 domain-containing protein [Dehalococcoides mccartyi]|uniref:DUF2779 domain-containing protein n=1 Tax=Dehalococcoides mccartyi TaxID=61435 RepID=UPI002FCC83EB
MPAVGAATQHVFDQGHLVGDLAHQLYPSGMNLHTKNIWENLKETRTCLRLRVPLFEAGFSNNRLYCRVDILNSVGEDEWDIIEVKSTNEVKDEHLHDVAFQRHCCQLAGLKIKSCHVMHLNRDYSKQGEINPNQLFVTEDVTDRLSEYTSGLEERIANMLEVISSGNCPEVNIGQHCNAPYSCLLQEECWALLPEHHVMTLYYGKKLGEELLEQGILNIGDIPEEVALNGKQKIQKECVVCGQPHVNAKEIQTFLSGLEYPLHFMDFETFATAIPIYDGTSPHQNIPFQFSMHLLSKPGAEPEHYSYLAEGRDDPRPGFLAELKKTIGPEGSILVYYEAFEKGRLRELARAFPGCGEWIDGILERIVDLIAPFKNFNYYHPKQLGSASLKQVLPALTDLSYNDMEIAEGTMASLRFMESAFGNISEEERQKIRVDLLTYCGQDTGGMIEIVFRLRQLAEGTQ